MKRILALMISAVVALGLIGCGDSDDSSSGKKKTARNSSDSISESQDSSVVTTDDYSYEDWTNTETTLNYDNIPKETEQQFEPNLKDIEYLEEDDKFLIINKEYLYGVEVEEKYIVDSNGNATLLSQSSLKSNYIQDEYDEKKGENAIVDIYGNRMSSLYIKNQSTDEICSCTKTDQGYVIWVKRIEDTPLKSEKTYIAYDEKGNELYSFNPEENDLKSLDNEKFGFRYQGNDVFLFYDYYEYSSVFISGVCCNPYKKRTFNVSRFIQEKENFSNGYAIDHNGNELINNEGNILYSSHTNEELNGTLTVINEGVFYNYNEHIFYDVNLNKIADLSSYKILRPSDGSLYYKKYIFQDGLCLAEMVSENGTWFWGILNLKGEWEVEPQVSDGDVSYYGKMSQNVIYICYPQGKFYLNTATNEKYMYDFTSDYNKSKCVVDGKGYYILNGKLYCFDFEKFTESQVNITYNKNESGEKNNKVPDIKKMNANAKLVFLAVNGSIGDYITDCGDLSLIQNSRIGPILISELDTTDYIQKAVKKEMIDNKINDGYVSWEIEDYNVLWAQWSKDKSGMVGQFPNPETDIYVEHTIGNKF